jgi:hypothetical protein
MNYKMETKKLLVNSNVETSHFSDMLQLLGAKNQ